MGSLEGATFDVAVGDDGANGCANAKDASGCHASPNLSEQHGFTSGTSLPTKSRHEGLLVLAHLKFDSVQKAYIEREMFRRISLPTGTLLCCDRCFGLGPKWLPRLWPPPYEMIERQKLTRSQRSLRVLRIRAEALGVSTLDVAATRAA